MKTVYEVLEKGNIGILESPTGTGKSLSLICGSLTWLREHKRAQYEISAASISTKFKDEPQWVIGNMIKKETEDILKRWEEREQRLAKLRAKEKSTERSAKRRRIDITNPSLPALKKDVDEEIEFLLDDDTNGDAPNELAGLSKKIRAKLESVGLASRSEQVTRQSAVEEEIVDSGIKIYYTSRTHSQITQFISELRRPEFPPSIPNFILQKANVDDDAKKQRECVKHVPLSSRQRLCINPTVSRLGSLSAINDRCAELQQEKGNARCSFLPSADNASQTHQFRDTALATLPDIEDLYKLGKSFQVCPYYASRSAVPVAEIVSLPYPLLLQKSARDALGIKIKDNIVIIDEAHNIMDAISGVHAAEIKMSDLQCARRMLGAYIRRFGKKLKGKNRVQVAQVGRVITSLLKWMTETGIKSPDGAVDSKSLLQANGADQINLFELSRYIQSSKLAYKIESYISYVEEQAQQAGNRPERAQTSQKRPSASMPVLHTLVSFILSLTHLSSEGRIFSQLIAASESTTGMPDVKLSYLLLSPAHAFSSIVSSARAVLLAGGTMSPFDEYTTHLFPSVSPTRLTTLSCDHVVPPSSLCVWSLASCGGLFKSSVSSFAAPSDRFNFSFSYRQDPVMIHQLGIALLNICTVVPDGVIVFFPSYQYLSFVVNTWKKDNSSFTPKSNSAIGGSGNNSIWNRLLAKKIVLSEQKDVPSERVLEQYQTAILGDKTTTSATERSATTSDSAICTASIPQGNSGGGGGALLLSVVGGKMSEGINFSDRLGRCVIIVGLPYPNSESPEWKAKLEYVEATAIARLRTTAANAPTITTKAVIAATQERQEQQYSEAQDYSRPKKEPKLIQTRDIDIEAATLHEKQVARQASRDYYENACMRAVNQSIGRVIRHKGDYAAIVLVDERFCTPRIRAKLPGWIQKSFIAQCEKKGLSEMMGTLGGFFRGKRSEGC